MPYPTFFHDNKANELFEFILSPLDHQISDALDKDKNSIQQKKNYVQSLKSEVLKLLHSPLHTLNPPLTNNKKPKGTLTRSKTAKRVGNKSGHAQSES